MAADGYSDIFGGGGGGGYTPNLAGSADWELANYGVPESGGSPGYGAMANQLYAPVNSRPVGLSGGSGWIGGPSVNSSNTPAESSGGGGLLGLLKSFSFGVNVPNNAAVMAPAPVWAARQTGGFPAYTFPQYVGPSAVGSVGQAMAYPAGSQWPPAGPVIPQADIPSNNPFRFGSGQDILGGNMKWIIIGLAVLLFVSR